MPKVNEKIPIRLQLFDGNSTKFVRAHIFNDFGSELSESPYSVPHLFKGLYARNDILMPDAEYITIQYKVYDDASYSTKSGIYADAVDVFFREETDDIVLQKLDQIISLLNSLIIGGISSKNVVVGDIVDKTLVRELKLMSFEKELLVPRIIGTIEEKNIEGEVEGINIRGEI